MKKLFTLLALTGAMFMTACDEGNGTEEENNGTTTVITLEEGTDKDRTIAATDTEVSVTFTTDGNWKSAIIETSPKGGTRANIIQQLPAIPWAEIDGSVGNKVEKSGTSGTHTIKIVLDANTTTTPRAIQLRIVGGPESQESLRVTQAGTGQTLIPKQVKRIKLTETSDAPVPSTYVSTTDFAYYADGRIKSVNEYDEGVDGTGTAYSFTYETGKAVMKIAHPYGPGGDYLIKLNANGYATEISLTNQTPPEENPEKPWSPDDSKVTLSYDNDGRLTQYEDDSYTYHFEWKNGNIVKDWHVYDNSSEQTVTSSYNYTSYSNTGANIDLNLFLNRLSAWPGSSDYVMEPLGYAGFTGLRSMNATSSYFVHGIGYSGGAGGESYHTEPSDISLAYQTDTEGYITKITATFKMSKYVGNSTTPEYTSNETEVYEITYAE